VGSPTTTQAARTALMTAARTRKARRHYPLLKGSVKCTPLPARRFQGLAPPQPRRTRVWQG
jgi:hypothetical protein